MKKPSLSLSPLLSLSCAVLLSLFSASHALALPGDLDTTFSGDGRQTSSVGANLNVTDAVEQPDGKIVVVGYMGSFAAPTALVARYTAAGVLDSTFGSGGKVTASVGTGGALAQAVTLQPDGKILICGWAFSTSSDFFLMRFNANGTLDTTFDTDGKVMTDFGASDSGYDIALAPSGKIIVAGFTEMTAGPSDFGDYAIACYNSNGSLDTSFDTDGMRTVSFSTNFDAAEAVAVMPDGRIVVAGYSGNGTDFDFSLLRLLANGALDTAFDTDGMVVTDFSGREDRGNAMCVQPNGDIVVAGESAVADVPQVALARYRGVDGALDNTFGTGGKFLATTISSEGCRAHGVALQPDGKVLVGGEAVEADPNNRDQFLTLRFTSDGVLDSTFSGDGIALDLLGFTDLNAGCSGSAVLWQGSGRILTIGEAEASGSAAPTIALVRYQGEPVGDLSVEIPALTFLTDGVSTVDYGVQPASAAVTKTFTLRNTGAAALNFDSTPVTVTGANAADFIVTQPAVNPPLAPGLTRTFTVKLGPTSAGTKTATLRVGTAAPGEDPDEDTFDIALKAEVSHPVAFEFPSYAVVEGNSLSVNIVRAAAGGAVDISLRSQDGTAKATTLFPALPDYFGISPTTLTFSNVQASRTGSINTAAADALFEPTKSFTLVLSGGTAPKGTPLTTTIRIIDSNTASTAGANGDAVPPPAPTFSSPTANAVLNEDATGKVTVTGMATDGRAVRHVEVSLDNFGTFTSARVNDPGTTSSAFTAQVTPTGPPPYSIKARTRDFAGNVTTMAAGVTFRVARRLPVELYTETFNGTTMVPNPVQKGSVTAGFAPVSNRVPGTTHTITATPVAGHVFDGWEVSGTSTAEFGTVAFSTNLGLIEVDAAELELSTLSFKMQEGLQLKAKFRDNPFIPVVGIYNGLVTSDDAQPDNGPAPDGTTPGNATEGFFTATVQPTGGFSGKLFIDGLELPVSGAFDNDGVARFGTTRATDVRVARPGKPYLEVYLTLTGMDDTDAQNDVITGAVSQKLRNEVVAVSGVRASRNFYSTAGAPTWVPGQFLGPLSIPGGVPADQTYTVLLQAMDILDQPPGVFTSESEFPTGHGYASMKLTRGGAVTMVGKLPDGTPLTYSGFATPDAGLVSVPFYVSLYGKAGCITGPMVLETPVETWDPELKQLQYSPTPPYPVLWFRPYQDTQHYQYGWPEGLRMTMEGAKYTVPPTTPLPGSSVLPDVTDGDRAATVKFFGGLLTPSPLTEAIEVSPTDAITELPLDPVFSLTITRATGVISGNFKHSDGTTQPYYGIIYQKGEFAADRGGFGFFMSQTPAVKDYLGEGGSMTLRADPP